MKSGYHKLFKLHSPNFVRIKGEQRLAFLVENTKTLIANIRLQICSSSDVYCIKLKPFYYASFMMYNFATQNLVFPSILIKSTLCHLWLKNLFSNDASSLVTWLITPLSQKGFWIWLIHLRLFFYARVFCEAECLSVFLSFWKTSAAENLASQFYRRNTKHAKSQIRRPVFFF